MKRTCKEYNGREQCRAVLRIWSGKCSGKQVSQEMGVSQAALRQWQEQAMDGMLAALAPREKQEAEQGPVLPPKLRRLLERKAEAQEGKLPRLVRRLAALQTESVRAEAK
jgi:transposase-like protein